MGTSVLLPLVLVACPSKNDTSPPRVSISSPASGASIAGVSSAQISASDDVGVSAVRLYAQAPEGNQRVLLGSAVLAPYVISFDTKKLPNGNEFKLVAVAEDSNNKADSDPVPIKVSNTDVPVLTGVYAYTLPKASTQTAFDCVLGAQAKTLNASAIRVLPSVDPASLIAPQGARASRLSAQSDSLRPAAIPADREVILEWNWQTFGGGGPVSSANGYGVYCGANLLGPFQKAVNQAASTGNGQKFSRLIKADLGQKLYGLTTAITNNSSIEGGFSNADSTTVLPGQEVIAPTDGQIVNDGRPLFSWSPLAVTAGVQVGYFLQVYDKNPLTETNATIKFRFPEGTQTSKELTSTYPGALPSLVKGTYYWWVSAAAFDSLDRADALSFSTPRQLIVP
jgi:Bacterial Ig domain